MLKVPKGLKAMFGKVELPLEGSPRAVVRNDANGHPRFRVMPFALTPLRAKLADGIAALALLGLLFVAIAWVIDRLDAPLGGTASRLAFLVVIYVVVAGVVRLALQKPSWIEMSTEAITVRRLFGSQRFDRNIEHSFALLMHDKAHDEQRRNEFAERKASAKGSVIQMEEYYAKSFHVVLVYAGQRRDLLTVYGQKDAASIVARLQYCDRCLNEAMRMGGGIHERPEDEWNDVPGGLPEA